MSVTWRPIVLAGFVSLMLGAGCASTVNPGPDKVLFKSDPPGASVSIDGVPVEGKTPLTVLVGRKAQFATLTAPGCEETKIPIARETNSAVGGNFFAGGMAGAMIDGSNGNAFQAKPEMNVRLDRRFDSGGPGVERRAAVPQPNPAAPVSPSH